MNFIKFLGILAITLLINTSAHSKKPFKTDIIFESEYGGIYSIKLPMFSGKGRWQPSFDIINNLSQKNCSSHAKDSFLLLLRAKSAFTVRTNGKVKVNVIKASQGLVPDHSTHGSIAHDYFRFFCGNNIEEVLINFATSKKFFSEDIYNLSRIGTVSTDYLQYKNGYKVSKISNETKKKITLKLKEVSQDRDYNLKTNKQGVITGSIAKANFGDVINKAKNLCKELGFTPGSEKYPECIMEVMEINDAYNVTKNQENILIARAKKKENIDLKFNYETSSGQKINRESRWTKFWQGAAWILYEHGDEIFKVILDLKYDTNLSGYNTKNEVAKNRSGLRCTGQRVGDMIYENCRGGGVFIKCTTTIIGQMAKRRCRQIS